MDNQVKETPITESETKPPMGLKFDLLDVLSTDEFAALGRKAIELKANGAYKKAIKAAVGQMTLSDAAEYAVYMLRKAAGNYASKVLVDDSIDAFSMAIPKLLAKNPTVVKIATQGILEVAASFKTASDCIAVLDKWYGPASVQMSDKAGVLDSYQRACGIIHTFYGPAIKGA
jgi:hypothetical protein